MSSKTWSVTQWCSTQALWTAAHQASLSFTPGICSNSCPLSPWCHPTTPSPVTPFSYTQVGFQSNSLVPIKKGLSCGHFRLFSPNTREPLTEGLASSSSNPSSINRGPLKKMGFLKSWPLALRRGLKGVDHTAQAQLSCVSYSQGRERSKLSRTPSPPPTGSELWGAPQFITLPRERRHSTRPFP